MKWLTILFTLLLATIIVLANMGTMPRPIKMLYDFPGGDRAGHFILYGILAFLANRTALSHISKWTPIRTILTISLLLFLLVGLEEWIQNFFPERTPSLVDLSFSYAGILAGAFLASRNRL